ncbi:MAG: hypothetical protein SWX82_35380 [Cyanobacteriota bacterium]|nr:hypothetical protein [Cyanobacteriota bacterium]
MTGKQLGTLFISHSLQLRKSKVKSQKSKVRFYRLKTLMLWCSVTPRDRLN